MKYPSSVRGRILLISVCLVALVLILYTVAVFLVANSYIVTNTGQTIDTSLTLLATRIEEEMNNVSSLAARISVDTELKTYLNGMQSSDWFSYYREIASMVQSNPSYSTIDRLIVADRSYANFLHFGGSVSTGRVLTQQLLLQELSHFEKGIAMSPVFQTEFSYRPQKVIAWNYPITDYNSGLTIGTVYVSIPLDMLFSEVFDYQTLSGEEIFITISDKTFRVSERALEEVATLSLPLAGKAKRYDNHRYIISHSSQFVTLTQIFKTPKVLATSDFPLFLIFTIALLLVIIAVFLSFYLNKAIYDPIKKLSERVEKIQESDFSQDTTIETNDEFGLIGRGINKLSGEVTALMDKRIEDERRKMELEYQMLQSQINPHFLYNTFNSIKWMATLQGANGIGEMVTSLSRLMKNISKKEGSLVTLSEELSFIDDYMVIMRYRYGNTITYVKHIDEECLDLKIPRFTLQPLVENAIFHGLEPKGAGVVSISARNFENCHTIVVSDNGVGFEYENVKKEKTESVFRSIGVDNVRQRLEYTFEGRARLEIKSQRGLGTWCIIHIDRETT